MFTVLSNTRNSNLYLIAALAIVAVILLTFAVVPAISTPEPVLVPVTGMSEAGSDYYERHPELSSSAPITVDMTGDFYLRHPAWTSNVQKVVVPVTGLSETSSDYFQRHPEWVSRAAGVATPLAESLERPGMACESPVDCR